MQKIICNMSAKDLGLKESADSFKAAKEINAAVVDVLETTYMRPEDKWIAVYQVMKKYKHLNAINQRSLDAIERVFFLHSGEQNPALPCVDAMAKKDAQQSKRAELSLFIAACCGTVALVSAALIGEPMINTMMIAGSSFVLGGSVTVAVGSWFGKF